MDFQSISDLLDRRVPVCLTELTTSLSSRVKLDCWDQEVPVWTRAAFILFAVVCSTLMSLSYTLPICAVTYVAIFRQQSSSFMYLFLL